MAMTSSSPGDEDRRAIKLAQTLGVRDVVLFNVTAIVGLRWISLAAAGGNTSIVLWFGAGTFVLVGALIYWRRTHHTFTTAC